MNVPVGSLNGPKRSGVWQPMTSSNQAASLGDVGHRDADVVHAADSGDRVVVSPGRRHVRRQRRRAEGRRRESFASREHASRLRPVVELPVRA